MSASDSTPFRRHVGPVIVGLLYFVSALTTLELIDPDYGITTIWGANALIIVAIIHAGRAQSRRYLAAGTVASLAANLSVGDLWSQAIGFTIANMSEVAIAVAMLARLCPNRTYFASLGQLGRFTIVAIGAALVSATLATIVSGRPDASMPGFWLSWFCTDILGMFVVVPPALVALALWRRDPTVRVSASPPLIAAVLGAVLLVNAVVFAVRDVPLLFLPLAALLMATYLLGQLGATAALTITAICGSIGTMLGLGPIALIDDRTFAVLFLQAYLVVIFASSLPLAGLLATQQTLLSRTERSDRFHRSIIDRSAAVIFETDSTGHWVFLSPSWVELTGIPVAEGLGRHFLTLVHKDDQAAAREGIGPLIAGLVDENRQEVRYRDSAGRWRWAMVQSSPLRGADGTVTGVFGTIVDVTDRIEAEVERARVDGLYRLLADHSSDVIFRVGPDGVRRYASPAALTVIGYDPAELIGTQAMETIHPEDRRGVWEVIQRLIGGEVTPFAIYRQLHKDGHYVWLEASYHLIRDPVSGEPVEMVSNVRDISRRRRAEVEAIEAARRVRESHRLLSMTESVAHVGHWRFDIASTTIVWSDEVFRIHGLPPGEQVSLARAIGFYHPDDQDRVTAQINRAIATGEGMEFAARIVRSDGDIRHVVSRAQTEQAPDGRVVCIFGIFQDVTRQTKTEAALREGEAYYRLLAENATDLIFRIGDDGCFSYVSPSIEALTGFTVAETIGQTAASAIHPEDWPRVAATMEVLRSGGASQGIVAYRRQRKDGQWRWLEANGRLSHDLAGTGVGEIVGVARDISDRKQFEQQLVDARLAAERDASEARLIAATDELTGLASRRLFMTRLGSEIRTAQSAGTPLSVAVFDVDHFKRVNDRFGHGVGDAVLRAVADTGVRMVRGQDLVGRIGGEEFAILMPGTPIEAAVAVGERLRAAIEGCGDRTGLPPVTVSIGVAAHRDGDDAGTLLGAADGALYVAKAGGRNRLHVAPERIITDAFRPHSIADS